MKMLSNKVRAFVVVAAAATGMWNTLCVPANAATVPILWTVSGTFNDGGAFSGDFYIDQYGFLSSPPDTSITTTAGAQIPFGQTYSVPPGAYNWTYPNAIELIVPGVLGSQEELYIQFLNPITQLAATDPIVYGFECIGWSCGYPNPYSYTADTRFINIAAADSAFAAATPLPSTWTMLIAGFVGLGFLAFRGKKRNAAATAAA
jgi:hypothetical protein